VVTGKPKTGCVEPGGGGAGVVWRVASFAARERPEPFSEVGERSRKSVTRKDPVVSEREPWAKLAGQREGTAAWMALSEVCSPSNMSCASLLRLVFMKRFFCSPLIEVVIFAVVEKPDPPWDATVVLAGSRERALMMAGSSFIAGDDSLRRADFIEMLTSLVTVWCCLGLL